MTQRIRKIIISGLDNAGKTSILTALDKKFDFQNEIMELKPTIKVEYHKTNFLGNNCVFWDMGGQEPYRQLYQQKDYIYFADTDLLVYIIDIQDRARFEESLEYLKVILNYFVKNNMDVPIIVDFHKYDPQIRDYPELNEDISTLKENIGDKYPSFKILYQQTSIYDIISIVQLISYGLSIFDEKFFELSLLLEKFLIEFNCASLILFDKNGIIISEFYREEISPDSYIELLRLIKEHLFLLKRIQEVKYEEKYNITNLENKMLSYLHKLDLGKEFFFVSVQIEENLINTLLEKFSDFIAELADLMRAIIS